MCEGVEGEWQMNCVVCVKWQCGQMTYLVTTNTAEDAKYRWKLETFLACEETD